MATKINKTFCLFDIDNNQISKNVISKKNCIYLRSFNKFDIKIISGDNCKIYSALQTGETVTVTNNTKQFTGLINFGYTLYVTDNCTIEVTDGTDILTYNFTMFSMLDDEYQKELYSTLLVNNYLPTFAELKPCLVSDISNLTEIEVIKRLLLDFRHVVKKKGTKRSISRFFKLIGFETDYVDIFNEFITPDNTLTTTPNKLVDEKTGNYHVLYDNFTTDEGYDENNLPINNIIHRDFESFFEQLLSAIALANIYFTSKEQEITFSV